MSILDTLLSVGLTGAGYAVKRAAQNKADKQRASILREIQALNDTAMNQQVATTQQQVQQYQPAQRIQALDNAERQVVGRLESDVLAPEAVATGPVYGGKVSDAYLQSRGQRTADELRYATRIAGLMGRAAAPAELALREGFSNQDAAIRRSLTSSDLRGDLGVRNLQLQSVEPNGGQMMAGDFLQGAGMQIGTPPPTQFNAPAPPPAQAPAAPMVRPGGAATLAARKPGTMAYWTNGRRQ